MLNSDYCLLVDDDETMIFLTEKILRHVGLTVEIKSAQDGQEAIEQIQEFGPPSLTFLDLRMPRMDGFDFLRCCHRDRLETGPVVVCSSSSLPEDREKALHYKTVYDFMEKPPAKELLLGLLENLPQLQALFSNGNTEVVDC